MLFGLTVVLVGTEVVAGITMLEPCREAPVTVIGLEWASFVSIFFLRILMASFSLVSTDVRNTCPLLVVTTSPSSLLFCCIIFIACRASFDSGLAVSLPRFLDEEILSGYLFFCYRLTIWFFFNNCCTAIFLSFVLVKRWSIESRFEAERSSAV